MRQKLSDEILIYGMSNFFNRLPIVNTDTDGGIINTQIGEKDGLGYVYVGVEDTATVYNGITSRGAFLKSEEKVGEIKTDTLFTEEAMQALEGLIGTQDEFLYFMANEVNTHRKLIYPFNFKMTTTKAGNQKEVISTDMHLNSQSQSGYNLVRIMARYDAETGRCPIEYAFGDKNGNMIERLWLTDYFNKWHCNTIDVCPNAVAKDIIQFSTANYVKTIVYTNKRGTYVLAFDCTGFYYEDSHGFHHANLDYSLLAARNLIVSEVVYRLEDYKASKGLMEYFAKSSALNYIASYSRFIVPYGCGEMNIQLK